MDGTNAGRKRVSLSQLCGGRARAGTVRMPAALPGGGACGVAAVCRRPVKDPPRQFGERAFTGFPLGGGGQVSRSARQTLIGCSLLNCKVLQDLKGQRNRLERLLCV